MKLKNAKKSCNTASLIRCRNYQLLDNELKKVLLPPGFDILSFDFLIFWKSWHHTKVLAKRSNCSWQSSHFWSFLKIDGIDLLSLIFEKDRPWSNWSRQTHCSFAYLIWAIWSNEWMSDDRMKEYLTLIKYSQKNILFKKWTETAQCSNAPSISAMGIFFRHIKNLRKFDSHCPTVLMKM